MQILTKQLSLAKKHPVITRILRAGDLLLDIETTGLSRAKHGIYLIGCGLVVDDNNIYVNQLFAEQPSEEAALLSEFSDFLMKKHVTRIITFNGGSFDLPFLAARAEKYALPLHLSGYELFDIYRELTNRKQLFCLANYRQKTVEQFLGICREDKYSGRELIAVYKSYTKSPDGDAEEVLLLHNCEDVLGMIDLLSIFAYETLLKSPPELTGACIERYTDLDGASAVELIVTLTPPCPLPGRLSCKHPLTGAYLHASGESTHLRVPLYHHMARLYYLDYKNYFYLPAEDMAVHKSVAACVDKAYREKATPENCYTWVSVTEEFLHSEQLRTYIGHVLAQFLAI